MPGYDFLYLGDNARTPYGSRSFEVVYRFTLQAVEKLFNEGCHLVILACNTASAKALRTIQQNDLASIDPHRRVLGVIRPTVELVDSISKSKHVGVVGTSGTISSQSYTLEIEKMFPHIVVTGEACPMWVPLVENNEFNGPGADYFIQKHLDSLLTKDPQIDTLILGCTHYPLLKKVIAPRIGRRVHIIDSSVEVALHLKTMLDNDPALHQALYDPDRPSRFFASDIPKPVHALAAAIFGRTVPLEKTDV